MKAFILILLVISSLAQAQESDHWYDRIQFKGYAHFRYNRLLETNNDLTSPGDRSIGDKQGFFLRRARLTLSGEVTEKVFVYIQPDYSQDVGTGSQSQNYLQIRDAYFDYALSENKEMRVRTGLSKVPYGFVNLQSSANRAPMDRDDAINTGVPNERDIGVFLMYAPTEIRRRFKELTANNLKGTGDYGVLALGVYNGQTINRKEENNDLHRVLRLTYPFKFSNGQYVEASLQAYEGTFTTSGTDTQPGDDFYDQRSAASFVFYPQPFGFQMEYNIGRGPEFDKDENEVKEKNLHGGYAQVNYGLIWKEQRYFPYVRYQEYDGGRKTDNGNHMVTQEWEFGTEWQPDPALEMTFAYAISDRIVESADPEQNLNEKGQLLRLQAQFNY